MTTVLEMLAFVTFCNAAAAKEMLPYGLVMECSATYEQLKDEVADGSYLFYVEWKDRNIEKVQPQVEIMLDNYFGPRV